MATAAQIAANRENSKKSTGPRTVEGKEKSRLNAIDHNLTGIRCLRTPEEQAAFDAYQNRLLPALAPTDEIQFEIARRIASTMFRLAQVPTIEANMIAVVRLSEDRLSEDRNPDEALAAGTAFLENSKAFNNLSLYEQRLSRGLQKDIEFLRKLQQQAQPEVKPAPAKRAVKSEAFSATSSGIGFVFSTPPADPESPPEAAQIEPENMAA